MSDSQPPPTCPRHPDRVSYVRCQRCDRPTCPECQRPAAVGIQCVDCVKQANKGARQPRTAVGGALAHGRPVVTLTLIAICVAVWLVQWVYPPITSDMLFAPVQGEHQPWRLLTSAFVHSPRTIFHIGFDMYALWICGQYLEPLLGRARFLALYLISALGGSVGYVLLATTPSSPTDYYNSGWYTGTLGASGAVFGLFLAMLILGRKLGLRTGGLVVLIAINAALSFIVPNIAWQVHVGGAVTGAVCGGIIAVLGREHRQLQWVGLALVVPILVALAAWRYSTVTLPVGF
ncbi:rhomboid family intramembrane serine protease [Leekyejoonella antrihumi]|uniref:Rhomboid family intramembrane serine protease n=1 Tax=Leekyejoonella antrihumi TaxID=1660198 RepID=A0A563E6V5_9MICO|nr:rhomboid family intramembrane serine protease [Leekyejoonella antrihumi]TWP38237.1 rhomboid family intramembrane serine protease [Leekyejoonella antrihumi]